MNTDFAKKNAGTNLECRERARIVLLEHIRQLDLKPNDRLPTVREIAEKLHISRGSAALAMKELAKDGIIVSHVGRGSFLASAKIPEKNRLIGMFVGNIIDPAFAEVVQLLESRSAETGNAPCICIGNEADKQLAYFDIFKRKNGDGVIGMRLDHKTIASVLNTGIPLVCIHDTPQQHQLSCFDYIKDNQEEAAYMLIRHLLQLGHSRIALSLPAGHDDKEPLQLRGYKKAYSEAGLPINKNYLVREPSGPNSVLSMDWYHKKGSWLLRQVYNMEKRPTALVVSNDVRAAGVLYEARQLGLNIPEDLSVAAFGNTAASKYFTPALSTMDLKLKESAELALQLLENQFQGEHKCLRSGYYLAPELVLRDSIAPVIGDKK